MAFPLVGLLGFLGGLLGKVLSIETAKFLLYRGLILSAMTFILPTVLYNIFARVVSETMEYAMEHVTGSGFQGSMVQLTGIAAWIAENIYLSQCVAIFLSALGIRFMLTMVKR